MSKPEPKATYAVVEAFVLDWAGASVPFRYGDVVAGTDPQLEFVFAHGGEHYFLKNIAPALTTAEVRAAKTRSLDRRFAADDLAHDIDNAARRVLKPLPIERQVRNTKWVDIAGGPSPSGWLDWLETGQLVRNVQKVPPGSLFDKESTFVKEHPEAGWVPVEAPAVA